jgi:hypothetical protein
MVKSGLIVGAIMFFLVLGAAAVVSPFCALCIPLFTGLGAGYLAGVFDHPALNGDAAKRGAGAGAIAAGLAILAQILASIINALVLQNPQYQLGRLWGADAVSPSAVWGLQILFGLCIGLLNVGLTAAFGAGGGAIWFSTAGKKQTVVPPAL